jgi:WXG100 family type VII secretion target
MGYSDDDLVYHFSGITDVGDAINRFCSEMQTNLDEVDSQFKALVNGDWNGMGADAFDSVSSKIHAAANDLEATLKSLSQKVNEAAFKFKDADARAAARIYQG